MILLLPSSIYQTNTAANQGWEELSILNRCETNFESNKINHHYTLLEWIIDISAFQTVRGWKFIRTKHDFSLRQKLVRNRPNTHMNRTNFRIIHVCNYIYLSIFRTDTPSYRLYELRLELFAEPSHIHFPTQVQITKHNVCLDQSGYSLYFY